MFKTRSTTPCLGIYSTTYGDDVCLGCGRSFDEVNNWNKMCDEEKIEINKI